MATTSHEFDFSDKALSPEERLANLFALNRGLVLTMDNLIRRVDAYNELLEEELDGRPGAEQYLESTREVVSRALSWLQLVNENVVGERDFETFDIRPMLEGVAKRGQAIVPEGTEMQADLLDEEVVVVGSLFQLQDLFLKTVRSHARVLGEGQPVLRLSNEVQAFEQSFFKLLRSKCAAGSYVRVSISAGAAAFDPERQVSFWDGLMAGVAADSPEDLGLVLVYGIVLEHGGEACFQIADDVVVALNLLLPVPAKRKDMQAPHNVDDESLFGTETILLVDDEDMIWDVIIDMLQELGYAVILAGNGEEAVEIYEANLGEIDLVILDMVMPKLDGHEAFFRLREIDPGVKVLLSSGYVSEADAADVLEAGALGFLQKPYRMVDLARRVRSIFDSGSS